MKTSTRIYPGLKVKHTLGDEGDFLIIASDGKESHIWLNGNELDGQNARFDAFGGYGSYAIVEVDDEVHSTCSVSTMQFIQEHLDEGG